MRPTTTILRRLLPAAAALLLVIASIATLRRALGTPDAALLESGEAQAGSAQAAIESAFRRLDPGLLAPLLSSRVKIHVAGAGLGMPDAYYGAGQLRVLMERLFADHATVSFEMTPPSGPQHGGRQVLSARWLVRDRLSMETEVRLAFGFAPEGPRLAIREIRELE